MRKIPLQQAGTHLFGSPVSPSLTEQQQDISALQARVDHPESQDFYFQKGLKNHQIRLQNLKNEYQRQLDLRAAHNDAFFEAQIDELELKIQEIQQRVGSRTIRELAVAGMRSRVGALRVILQVP